MAGTTSISAADSDTSVVDGIVLSPVSRLGAVTITHHGRVKSVILNSASGPDLAIQGAVTIGNNPNLAREIGTIVVNNAKSIVGDLSISTRSSAGTLGSVLFASRSSAPLVVNGTVTIVSHTQTTQRIIEFVNFKSMSVVGNAVFANIYKVGSASLGPVIFNGKAINAALTPVAAYNPSTGANDPDCINKCRGRGSAYASNTSCSALTVCRARWVER